MQFMLNRILLTVVEHTSCTGTTVALESRFSMFCSAQMLKEEKVLKIVYRELSSLASDLGFSPKLLYSVSNRISHHYKTVKIPKKNGKERVLKVPDDKLKMIQKAIAQILLKKEPISVYAYAYGDGCSTVNNAKKHVGAENILRIDIKHFFDNITFAMVKNMVFTSDKYSETNRILLTILCINEHTVPQGAPTSPFISNIIMRDFDITVGTWCKEHNICYTRYCDDMTFSGTFDKEPVIELVKSELKKLGFFLNESKTTFIHHGQCKNITGIVVNEKLSIPRNYKKEIRKEMYYCMKYGIYSHMCYKKIPYEIDQYINTMLGKINYVLSVEDNAEMER